MSISINFRIFQDFSGFFRIFQDFSGFFRIFQEFLRICFAGGRKDAANMIAESVSLQDFGSGIFFPRRIGRIVQDYRGYLLCSKV